MIADRCQHEDELLEALGRGFIGPDLSAHMQECPSCVEIRLVAGAFLDERVQAVTEAPVPSAGTMLWRMQMRHLQESQATARRSLLVGQAVTLTVAIMLVVSFFGTDVAMGVREVIDSIRLSTPLLLTVATWLLVAPIAGYVAIRQK